MSYSPSTGPSSANIDLGEQLTPQEVPAPARKTIKDPVVNNYNYEWDEEGFFNKRVNDVVTAPWDLTKRLEKFHMLEVAWGSRQAAEITVGEILKKVRAHKWQGMASHTYANRRSLVPEITYRDLAQILSEASLVPACEIRQNCIILCLPPLCCIVLHDRVMIHVNNVIDLDSLLLRLERLTLAYSKKAEETQNFFIRYYADDPDGVGCCVRPARSMLLTDEIVEAVNEDAPYPSPPVVGFQSGTYTAFDALGGQMDGLGGPISGSRQPSGQWDPAQLSGRGPTTSRLSASTHSIGGVMPPSRQPMPASPPWNTLHQVIMSGNVELIQTIPRFVLFPLEFAFLEILISYAFGELNKEVNALDAETQKIMAETRRKAYSLKLIDAIRDIKLPIHTMLENIAGLTNALHTILATPEDMAMMELTRLFYQSKYYYNFECSARDGRCSGGDKPYGEYSSVAQPHHCHHHHHTGGSCGSSLRREDTNPNLEILLEFFSQEIGLIHNRVKHVATNLQSAEKHIQMIMSFRRNQLHKWDIGCGIAAVGLGVGAVISGTLGMNVPNFQEENNYAFGWYVGAIAFSGLFGFILAYWVTFRTYFNDQIIYSFCKLEKPGEQTSIGCIVSTRLPGKHLFLHFGLNNAWEQPRREVLEPLIARSDDCDKDTLEIADGYGRLELIDALSTSIPYLQYHPYETSAGIKTNGFKIIGPIDLIQFCIYRADDGAWIKNANRNFVLDIAGQTRIAPPPTHAELQWSKFTDEMDVSVNARTSQGPSKVQILMRTTLTKNRFYLHWGAFGAKGWKAVDLAAIRSPVVKSCPKSHDTEFLPLGAGVFVAEIEFAPGAAPRQVAFVIKAEPEKWFVSAYGDCIVPIPESEEEIAVKIAAAARQRQAEETEVQAWKSAVQEFRQINGVSLPDLYAETKAFEHPIEVVEGELSDGYGYFKFLLSGTMKPASSVMDESSVESDEDSDGTAGRTDGFSASPDSSMEAGHKLCASLVLCSRQELVCHWGLQKRNQRDWVSAVAHNKAAAPGEAIEYTFLETAEVSVNACDSKLREIANKCYHAEVVVPVNVELTNGACEGLWMVFHDPKKNVWIKNADGKDVHCQWLRSGGVTDKAALLKCGVEAALAQFIVECECVWESMTLWHRYNLVMERVRGLPKDDDRDFSDFWSWIFVWLRFNHLNWLDWQRRYNTRPSMLAHSTMELSLLLAEKWRTTPKYREWLRLAVSCVGRGGNQGQRIRDQILEIMHKHKISERAGHFYEQWHQKLHNNTTPDDVGICKALIRYYETNGDMTAYWSVLREHRIDALKLAGYERPITHEPYLHDCDRSELLRDFRAYLEVLMDIHDSRDLWKSLSKVRHELSADVVGCIEKDIAAGGQDALSSGESLRRIRAISFVRGEVMKAAARINNNYVTRDLLLLDFALASIQSVVLQNTRRDQYSISEAVEVVMHLVEDCMRSSDDGATDSEWRLLRDDFRALGRRAADTKFTHDVILDSLMVKSLIDRLTRAVGDEMERIEALVGPKSMLLGTARGISEAQLNVFTDEVLRGSVLFSVSQIISVLEPKIRERAKMSPWQIISPVRLVKNAYVESVPALEHLQNKKFARPTLLISGRISGEEDIPDGVVAIIVRDAASAPDVLSHVSVRARNARVLLTVCFDKDLIAEMERAFAGKEVDIELIKGLTELVMSESPLRASDITIKSPKGEVKQSHAALNDLRNLRFKKPSETFCAAEKEYSRELVGSKSHNLKLMKEALTQLKGDYHIPLSFAFVFGSFEKCVLDPVNTKTRENILALAASCKSTENRHIQRAFAAIGKEIMSLEVPDGLRAEFADQVARSGIGAALGIAPATEPTVASLIALRQVWLSVFQMRPWVALMKAERSWLDLSMAVLVQPLIGADYAFVLHSRHPYRDEATRDRFMYGEIVQGLGEVLVGNYPGRALSWECERGSKTVRIISWPSKSQCLRNGQCLMFRSDSNGEDLADFAGAGLFDSIPAQPNRLERCSYSEDPLVVDAAFRKSVLERVSEAAWEIEALFKTPMDVEGCLEQRGAGVTRVHIVQCRPQV